MPADSAIITGGKIRRERVRRGLSRRTVAELVGRSEEWLRQIEVGSRQLDSISIAVKLVHVLGFSSLAELVDLSVPVHHEPGRSYHLAEQSKVDLAVPAILRSPDSLGSSERV